jgi:hypothetical protein
MIASGSIDFGFWIGADFWFFFDRSADCGLAAAAAAFALDKTFSCHFE